MKYTESDALRFNARVDRGGGPDSCHEWRGGRFNHGYGQFYLNGKMVLAHRFSWTMSFGGIPEGSGYHGTVVRHRCDNKLCQNPSHLEIGTQADNVRDMMERGRKVTVRGDASGSRLHPERVARGDRHGSRLHPETVLRGDDHGRTKIPNRDLRRIFVARAHGLSLMEISKMLGVSRGQIGHILRGIVRIAETVELRAELAQLQEGPR